MTRRISSGSCAGTSSQARWTTTSAPRSRGRRSSSAMSTLCHSTRGSLSCGGRRARATTELTSGVSSSWGSSREPTLPLAPVTTIRMAGSLPGPADRHTGSGRAAGRPCPASPGGLKSGAGPPIQVAPPPDRRPTAEERRSRGRRTLGRLSPAPRPDGARSARQLQDDHRLALGLDLAGAQDDAGSAGQQDRLRRAGHRQGAAARRPGCRPRRPGRGAPRPSGRPRRRSPAPGHGARRRAPGGRGAARSRSRVPGQQRLLPARPRAPTSPAWTPGTSTRPAGPGRPRCSSRASRTRPGGPCSRPRRARRRGRRRTARACAPPTPRPSTASG